MESEQEPTPGPVAAALREAVKEVRYCRENRLPVNLVRIAAEFGVEFSALVAAVRALPPMLPVRRRGG
ncbi:MAG: hypothetical protein H7Z41_04360 [Cytophagales bacterium]|nr:hypothetical protein [Armatimonadota bacterium]